MATTDTDPLAAYEHLTDALDVPCLSARDVLGLVAKVRDTKPRDGLRALEDALLDVVAGA